MLFYVRYRLKNEKLADLADEVHSGGFPYKAKHVFASMEDSLTGLTIWEANDRAGIDEILSKLKNFAEVFEVIPVVSAEYAQQRIFQELY